MDINERKAQVKAIFRDTYNWWLANCDLDMTEQFFITAAREMVKLSDAGAEEQPPAGRIRRV